MAGFSVITYALCNKNTQKVISEAIESLSEGMTFKGSVATLDDLPENPLDGDLYIIETDKSKAVFFGDKWIEFDHELSLIAGQNIDIKLDSEGNTVISSTGGGGSVDPESIALVLPNALKIVLSEQVVASGLIVDAEDNIKLDTNNEYFEFNNNKLTLKQDLIIDANDDTGEEPVVGTAEVGLAIVTHD